MRSLFSATANGREPDGERSAEQCSDPWDAVHTGMDAPVRDIPGEVDPTDRGAESSTRNGTPYLPAVLVWLPALILGFAGYFGLVAPLEERILAGYALGMAKDLEATVTTRSVTLDTVTRRMEMADFLQPGVLGKLLKDIQRHFPDFRSLEIIDANGVIAAMVGELPLSAEGLASNPDTGRLTAAGRGGRETGWIFRDDPAGDSYFITCKRTSQDGKRWFVRARFSRHPIHAAKAHASRDPDLRADLVPLKETATGNSRHSTAPSRIGPPPGVRSDTRQVQTSWSWWTGPSKAETKLPAQGWLVSVNIDPRRMFVLHGPFLIVVPVLLLLLIMTMILRSAQRRAGNGVTIVRYKPDSPSTASVSDADPESTSPIRTAGESSEGGSTAHDGFLGRRSNERHEFEPFDFGPPYEEKSPTFSGSEDWNNSRGGGEDLVEPMFSQPESSSGAPVESDILGQTGSKEYFAPGEAEEKKDIPETFDLTWLEPVQEAEEPVSEPYRETAARETTGAEDGAITRQWPEYVNVEWTEDPEEDSWQSADAEVDEEPTSGTTPLFAGR